MFLLPSKVLLTQSYFFFSFLLVDILRFRKSSFWAPSLALFAVNSSSSAGGGVARCATGLFPLDTFVALCL